MTNPNLFTDEQIERLNRDIAAIGRHARASVDAITKAFTPVLQRTVAAMQPLIELANSPQGKALIADYERRKALGLTDTQACHCLCVKNHPDRPLCLGEVMRRDIRTLQFSGSSIGTIDVPMCKPCAAATA